MADEVYTIKEMIQEFREENNKRFDTVDKRLDGIDMKQAYANGRTRKLELWRSALVGAGMIIAAIGPVFTILYVQNVVNDYSDKNNERTAKEVVSLIEDKYDLEIKK